MSNGSLDLAVKRLSTGALYEIQTDIKCLYEPGGEFNCPGMQLLLTGLANVVRS